MLYSISTYLSSSIRHVSLSRSHSLTHREGVKCFRCIRSWNDINSQERSGGYTPRILMIFFIYTKLGFVLSCYYLTGTNLFRLHLNLSGRIALGWLSVWTGWRDLSSRGVCHHHDRRIYLFPCRTSTPVNTHPHSFVVIGSSNMLYYYISSIALTIILSSLPVAVP